MKLPLIVVLVLLVLVVIGSVIYTGSHKVLAPAPSPLASNPPLPTHNPVQSPVIFPSGAETLAPGKTYTLKWTGGPDPIQIFLIDKSLESQGASVSIVDKVFNIKNTGSYDYKMPANLKDGMYKFQIGDMNSNYFQVSSTATTAFCLPDQLKGEISTEGAAGNIFGNVTLKNTSASSCQLPGAIFLSATFNPATNNINVTHQGQPTADTFTLTSGQTIYSQIHYPNGPQCSGAPTQVTTTFTYKVSPESSVTFQTDTGSAISVPSCTNSAEKTDLQIWPFSDQPITPQ